MQNGSYGQAKALPLHKNFKKMPKPFFYYHMIDKKKKRMVLFCVRCVHEIIKKHAKVKTTSSVQICKLINMFK